MAGHKDEAALADENIALDVLDICGHYVFNDPSVAEQINILYRNLAAAGIDGQRFVVDRIKVPIRQYIECYRLDGVGARIAAVLDAKEQAAA